MGANFKLALRVLRRRRVFTTISLVGIALTLLVLVIAATILDNSFAPGGPETRLDRTLVVNTIGHLAEAAWHHPDLAVSYASAEVRLQNHAAKGITDKDFELARKIEDVVGWQPGKAGGALTGTPQEDPGAAYIKYD